MLPVQGVEPCSGGAGAGGAHLGGDWCKLVWPPDHFVQSAPDPADPGEGLSEDSAESHAGLGTSASPRRRRSSRSSASPASSPRSDSM
jgi:hypothetical protein